MRLPYRQVAPGAIEALAKLDHYLTADDASLPAALLELLKVRVSQINRCAFCINKHSQDARALGESEQRLYALNAWRETPFFSDRERAALAWAEANTLLSQSTISEADFAAVSQHFTDRELVDLTLAIATINAWNRIGVSFAPIPR
ncbi:carboxymuconolactone decarboxylase family protein [Gallaecimonas sp. GXIMD1310]|uniref:carboxymuconolactone decarboxylase family protein n=1 Tax=Gallaecimonas sp. GXIMD1310 TaxID=3131926 RepID=UPI003248F3B5